METLQDPGSYPKGFILPLKLRVADNARHIDTSINHKNKTYGIE